MLYSYEFSKQYIIFNIKVKKIDARYKKKKLKENEVRAVWKAQTFAEQTNTKR